MTSSDPAPPLVARRGQIDADAFEDLRSGRLDLKSRLGLHVTDMTFAKAASWAVWAPPTPGSTNTDYSRDLTAVASYDVLADAIHADVVFVALNKGTNPTISYEDDWANFHGGSRDYMLDRAIRTAPGGPELLWGAYMTDFYKGLPTANGAELKRYLRAAGPERTAEIETTMADLLRRELELLGSPSPVLICLGGDAHQVVNRMFGGTHQVEHMTHYSASVVEVEYRDEAADVCARIAAAAAR